MVMTAVLFRPYTDGIFDVVLVSTLLQCDLYYSDVICLHVISLAVAFECTT